jgi:hypothetical protein
MRSRKKTQPARIVKVQLSLVTNAGERQVLIYDEHRTFTQQFDCGKDLANKLHYKEKAFWWATFPPDPHVPGGFMCHLQRPAPWQEW